MLLLCTKSTRPMIILFFSSLILYMIPPLTQFTATSKPICWYTHTCIHTSVDRIFFRNYFTLRSNFHSISSDIHSNFWNRRTRLESAPLQSNPAREQFLLPTENEQKCTLFLIFITTRINCYWICSIIQKIHSREQILTVLYQVRLLSLYVKL